MMVKYKDEQWWFRVKYVLLRNSTPHHPSLRIGTYWTSWNVLSSVGCSPQSSIIKSMGL